MLDAVPDGWRDLVCVRETSSEYAVHVVVQGRCVGHRHVFHCPVFLIVSERNKAVKKAVLEVETLWIVDKEIDSKYNILS